MGGVVLCPWPVGQGLEVIDDDFYRETVSRATAAAEAARLADKRADSIARYLAGFCWRGRSWDSHPKKVRLEASRIAERALLDMYRLKERANG